MRLTVALKTVQTAELGGHMPQEEQAHQGHLAVVLEVLAEVALEQELLAIPAHLVAVMVEGAAAE